MNYINKSRRKAILTMGMMLSAIPMSKLLYASDVLGVNPKPTGNFSYIYGDDNLKKEFYDFLVNVFHLYPEEKMHGLISSLTQEKFYDQSIYRQAQESLPSIKPFLGDLRYSVPALSKQKDIIAKQTTSLLGDKKTFNGYVEMGSNGRYLDALEEDLNIDGDIFFLSELSSNYSPVDMIDRGQLFKAGKDLKLNNYKPNLKKHISGKSIDLVTVYIGFHHCPLELREEFITSIRDMMTDDGILILRDHDARNEKMRRMVALAHDVFNMGTSETWKYNEDELRNFYSLVELDQMLNKYGFKSDGRQLYQKGDPTKNALMIYRKA